MVSATKVTRVTLDAARTIEADPNGNASSIWVYGFLINNNTAGEVTVDITDNDGTSLFTIAMPGAAASQVGNFVWDVKFLADNGVKIALDSGTSVDVSVTVVHSAAGI